MGYCVDMSIDGVIISKKNVDRALRAINNLFMPGNLKRAGGASWTNGVETKHYSWVRTPIDPFTDIIKALAEWRYQAALSGSGDVIVEYFTGEKLGDDDILWTALGPFVNPGGQIFCSGEDGAAWKWTFNGSFNEISARLIYEDEEPEPKPKEKPTARRRGVGLDGNRKL